MTLDEAQLASMERMFRRGSDADDLEGECGVLLIAEVRELRSLVARLQAGEPGLSVVVDEMRWDNESMRGVVEAAEPIARALTPERAWAHIDALVDAFAVLDGADVE